MKEKVLSENIRFLDLPVDPPAPLIELPEEVPNHIGEEEIPSHISENKQGLLCTQESLSCEVLEERNPDQIKYQEIHFDGSGIPTWAWAFYVLKEDSDRKHEEVSKHFSSLAAGMEHLMEQNKQLRRQNNELADQLALLVEESEERAQKSLEKQKRKEKRLNAIKQIQRDAISYPEFEAIMESVEFRFKDVITRARVICSLVLLFFTGLRISNLLLFTHRHMNELLTDGKTTIPLIKGGKQRHLISIGLPGQMYLKRYQPYIDFLMFINNAQEPKFLFFSRENPSEAINRVSFTTQVNEHLSEWSTKLQKHIRSHSFRATYITDLLDKGVSIEKTKDIIGHKNISTTDKYRRSHLAPEEMGLLMDAVQAKRVDKSGSILVDIVPAGAIGNSEPILVDITPEDIVRPSGVVNPVHEDSISKIDGTPGEQSINDSEQSIND